MLCCLIICKNVFVLFCGFLVNVHSHSLLKLTHNIHIFSSQLDVKMQFKYHHKKRQYERARNSNWYYYIEWVVAHCLMQMKCNWWCNDMEMNSEIIPHICVCDCKFWNIKKGWFYINNLTDERLSYQKKTRKFHSLTTYCLFHWKLHFYEWKKFNIFFVCLSLWMT
jgi:hypothetical protein